MTIGPEPMMSILLMSVLLGICLGGYTFMMILREAHKRVISVSQRVP